MGSSKRNQSPRSSSTRNSTNTRVGGQERAGGRRGVVRHLQGEPMLQNREFPARIDPKCLL